jgi:hypothetical protein
VGAGEGLEPDYAGDLLGGMLLTGMGTGLALSMLVATGSASLPAHSFATGSAAVTMLRQIGFAVGVALFVAVVGASRTASDAVSAYRGASAASPFGRGRFSLSEHADAWASSPAIPIRRGDSNGRNRQATLLVMSECVAARRVAAP